MFPSVFRVVIALFRCIIIFTQCTQTPLFVMMPVIFGRGYYWIFIISWVCCHVNPLSAASAGVIVCVCRDGRNRSKKPHYVTRSLQGVSQMILIWRNNKSELVLSSAVRNTQNRKLRMIGTTLLKPHRFFHFKLRNFSFRFAWPFEITIREAYLASGVNGQNR